MDSFPDRYAKAYAVAIERARSIARSQPQMQGTFGPQLSEEERRFRIRSIVKPLVMARQSDAVLRWIYRHAPPGTDATKELLKMLKEAD